MELGQRGQGEEGHASRRRAARRSPTRSSSSCRSTSWCRRPSRASSRARTRRGSRRRSSPRPPTARRRPTPTTSCARKGAVVIPDILANAGGVTVSYFEWVQDLYSFFWDPDVVRNHLERTIRRAYEDVAETARRHDTDLRTGALILGVGRVEEATRHPGPVPVDAARIRASASPDQDRADGRGVEVLEPQRKRHELVLPLRHGGEVEVLEQRDAARRAAPGGPAGPRRPPGRSRRASVPTSIAPVSARRMAASGDREALPPLRKSTRGTPEALRGKRVRARPRPRPGSSTTRAGPM